MTSFAWSDSLSVGHEAIDNDHKNLINLVGNLNTAVQLGSNEAVLADIFDELINSTKEHFKREENLMRRIGYAEFQMHKQEHDRLICGIEEFHAKFEHGEAMPNTQMLRFLFDWLFNHILFVDKKLTWALQQMKSG